MTDRPLMRVLAGEAVWPPPVWLMRQAGRYLPEYRAMRENAGGFLGRCMNPDLATDITLQPIHRYAMDAAILFSDILVLPWAMGQDLRFAEGEGPLMTPVRDSADLARLKLSRAPAETAPVMETVRRVRGALPEACSLLGFAGSPFTVACYMVEGSGSRDFAATRTAAYANAAFFDRLIDMLVEATIEYLASQLEAGADAVMLFDSWAGILPPPQFFTHVVRPTARIIAELRRRFPRVKVIGFPRLAGTLAAEYVAATGVDCVGLDTGVDAACIAATLPVGTAIQGNLDPMVLIAGGDALTQETSRIRDSLRGRPHIFNLGHGILPQTPPAHVAEMLSTLRRIS